MKTIRFTTDVDDGTIKIPDEFRDEFQHTVQVTVSSVAETQSVNYIEYLMRNPVHSENFRPLTREETHARE